MLNFIKSLALCWTAGVGSLIALSAQAGEMTPESWLEQVAEAVKTLAYQGKVVHAGSGEMTTYAVAHAMNSDGMEEYRIRAIDKPAVDKVSSLIENETGLREIVRTGEEVICYLPDKNMGVKERRKVLTPLFVDGSVAALRRYYAFKLLDQARVAGRVCQMIEAEPLDGYRYGYRWCADKEHMLPLKSSIYDEHRALVESQMFVEISFGQPEPPWQAPANAQMNWMSESHESEAVSSQSGDAISGKLPLQTGVTVHGFSPIRQLSRHSPGLNKTVEHWVYSDGLARISVFRVPKAGAAGDGTEQDKPMRYSMGAMHFASLPLDGAKLMVIGEAPMPTIEAIAMQLSKAR